MRELWGHGGSGDTGALALGSCFHSLHAGGWRASSREFLLRLLHAAGDIPCFGICVLGY